MPKITSFVNQPDIWLVVCRASELPAGIKESWDRLGTKLASLKGRKFHGLTFFEAGHLVRYAGLQPQDGNEAASLGFPMMTLKGGDSAWVKLMNWPQHADEIGPILDALMEECRKDPEVPTVEFYRSQTDLHLMIPLQKNEWKLLQKNGPARTGPF